MATFDLTNVFLANAFVDEFGNPYPPNGAVGAFKIDTRAERYTLSVEDDDSHLQDNYNTHTGAGENSQTKDGSGETLASSFNGLPEGASVYSRFTLEVVVTTPSGAILRGEATQIRLDGNNQTAYAFQFDVPAGSTVEVERVIYGGDTRYSDFDTESNPTVDYVYNQVMDYKKFVQISRNTDTTIDDGDLTSVIVRDNDGVLNDNVSGNGHIADANMQILAADYDGHATGSSVYSMGYYEMLNVTTGQTGKAYRFVVEGGGSYANSHYFVLSDDFTVSSGDEIKRLSGLHSDGNVNHSKLFAEDSIAEVTVDNTNSLTAITDGDPDLLVRSLGEELIVNGDFETHAGAGSNGQFFYNQLEGWDLAGEATQVEVQTADYRTGNTPGNSIVELDATADRQEGIKQTVQIDEDGTYQLSYDYYARVSNASAWWFDAISNNSWVRVDGELVQVNGTGTNRDFDGGPQTRTIDIELTAGSHVIEFIEDEKIYHPIDNGIGAGIDNVSLRKVDMVYATGEVSGTFYFDGDRDGRQDASEAGLGGRTVYLLHEDQSFVLDENGRPVSTMTDADGEYKFTGVDVGNYRVGFVENDAPASDVYEVSAFVVNSGYTLENGHFNAIKGTKFTIEGATSTVRFIDPDGKLDIDARGEVADGNGFVELNGELYKYVADFTAKYPGSDGVEYEFFVVDVDLDGDGLVNAAGHVEDGYVLIPMGAVPPAGVTLTARGAVTSNPTAANAPSFTDLAATHPEVVKQSSLTFADAEGTGPNGEEMEISEPVTVIAGMNSGDVDAAAVGKTVERTIEICENDTFVEDFDTSCQLVSEDVYFMVNDPVCARIGRFGFDENQTQSWNNSGVGAIEYNVFLDEPATVDLTFTIRLTVDPDKVAIGKAGYAPPGFAYLTDQPLEINAPRFEEIEVTVKAGETESEAFYVGTESASKNYVFGIEIDSIYNHDIDELCERVARVATTPVAIDLNHDGEIGVTGETTSSDKSGLTAGKTVNFDMDADGIAERIEWFDGSGDGILIDNRDGNAANDMDGSRLFGDDNGAYSDGYAKLRALFDSNGDGAVNGTELDGLQLWVDDGDAVVEAGELQSLQSHSITEISGQVSVETDENGRPLLRSTVNQDFEATGNVTYSLEGPDADLFTVNAQGVVNFIDAPDFENPQDAGGDNVYNVTLVRTTDDPTCMPARENLRIEVIDKPSLGDTVWFDANGDGELNNGEQGVAGVTVKLQDADGNVLDTRVTDDNGNYLFDDIAPGDYKVMFVAPDGYSFTVQSPIPPEGENNDSDADVVTGMTGLINLSEGEDQLNIDAGLVLTDTGTAELGDKVWFDTNGDGLFNNGEQGAAGVTVNLLDDSGQVIDTEVTDADGMYLFTGLNAGDYQVEFVALDGYEFTTESGDPADATNNDSDADQTTGLTSVVNLSIGESELDVDAGLVLTDTGTAELGDKVWFDTNGDGLFNNGEQGAAGVTVNLLDDSGQVIDTEVTDADGMYLFTGLNAGDYQVEFVALDGYEFTTESGDPADATNNDSDADQITGLTSVVNLSIGESELDVDAGLVLTDTGTAELGDTVWFDTNRDGLLNNGEQGEAGVTVELLNASGQVQATQQTRADGTYLFTGLMAGDYQVRFSTPAGYIFTTESNDPADTTNNDSDADAVTGLTSVVNLSIGESELDVDAGLVLEDTGTAELGDKVWFDTNGDGVFNNGEQGAAGVTVNLLNSAGQVVRTTATDADGMYLFTGLNAGDYQVQFVALDGYDFTTQSGDPADANNNDSDADPVTGLSSIVTLSIGESELDVDAGLVRQNADPDAADDQAKTCADVAKAVDVLDNDSDSDGDTLQITAVDGQAISEGQTITASDGVAITLSGGQLIFDASGTTYADALIGEENTATYSYEISDGNGGTASANVDMTFCGFVNTLDTINDSLPSFGEMTVSYDTSYDGDLFTVLVNGTGDARFDGISFDNAYCVARDDRLVANQPVEVNLYVATEDNVPDGIVANEDNLDAINWILNQDFQSMDNGDGTGQTYTEAEIQGAVWGLTDDFLFVNAGAGTKYNAQEIYDLAIANGEGFEAGSGDVVGIILSPTDEAEVDGEVQPFIIGVDFDDLAQDCICL